MSWAAGRQTTRLEDRAYSLMGLFDVNMPLLYGEGQKAFIRLQQEILKQTDDQSIFAWSIHEEMHSHVRLSGLVASSLEDFKDASMVKRLGFEFVEDYENPFQLENRLVRLRLQMIDQVRTMKLKKVKSATQRYNAVHIEQDGAAHGVGLLRPSSPSGLAKTELAEVDVEDIETQEHQITPTIAITEALPLETGEGHSRAPSGLSDAPTGEFLRKGKEHTLNHNFNDGKGWGERVDKTSDPNEVVYDESSRSYIYEPVIVVPLQCHIDSHQLAIMLTKGSIKATGKVLSRLHNPSVMTIDALQNPRLTLLTTVYAEAHSRFDQKPTGIRNSHDCLEITVTSLLATGYMVHVRDPGWEYIPSRSILVEKRKAEYNDGPFAATPLILFHRQNDDQEPSLLAEAFVLSIPNCQKDVLKCEINVIMNVSTSITARDYKLFPIQFSGHDSQICVPIGGHNAILVKYRRGLKLVNLSIVPIDGIKAVLHGYQEPYTPTPKTIRLSSEIVPVLRSLREGLMEKPGISADIFDESGRSR